MLKVDSFKEDALRETVFDFNCSSDEPLAHIATETLSDSLNPCPAE